MPDALQPTPRPSRPTLSPGRTAANAEVQAWIAQLESQQRHVTGRNRYLALALGVGLLLLMIVLGGVYRATTGSYAVIENVEITQSEVSQGRLTLSFDVTKPGKVFYRRTSGAIQTDLLDYYDTTGHQQRVWSWVYEPGEDIEVTVKHRQGTFPPQGPASFPTLKKADIVILIDTTGSMSRTIAELKEKCVLFSEKLTDQALEHRFALIGFGDVNEGPWCDTHDFTDKADRFRESVIRIRRFDGGDQAESALEVIDAALQLPLDEDAIRRFYLVTDNTYHEASGKSADDAGSKSAMRVEEIVRRLDRKRVMLHVFSRPEFAEDYARLLDDGRIGRFREIEDFGQMLSEGRVLED